MNKESVTQHQEISLRVAYGMHSEAPSAWGWEVSSKDGYSYGTADTEHEALHDGIAQLQPGCRG